MAETMSPPPQSGARSAVNRRKQVLAGVFGHLVEWFDWAVYTYLAVFFSDAFFPKSSDSDLLPLIGTFGVFAVGFLARPFGGLILGSYGDRHGRRAAMTLSISMMGAGCLIIACSPTYDQVGLLAPLLLTLARLLQGISTGGEWGAAASFISESSPDRHRGFYSSLLYVGSNAGKILLTASGALMLVFIGESGMEGYGWRIMFVAAALLSLFGWFLRRNTVETADLIMDETERAQRPRMLDFLREHPSAVAKVFGLTVGPAVVTYLLIAYLPTLAVTDGGMAKGDSLRASSITLVVFLIAQPIMGTLSDRIGRKPLMIGANGAFAVGAPFLLMSIDGSFTNLIVVQSIGLLVLSMATAPAAAVMAEQFPPRLRISGIAMPYSVAVAVFGGTAPVLATWLQDLGHVSYVGLYVSVISLASLYTVLRISDMAGKPLPA